MNVEYLLSQLEIIAPNALSEKWDNCGLLIGDPKATVDYIGLALEADEAVIDALPENATLIVHHPLIFSSIKSIRYDQYPGVYIQKCIKKNIQVISMHTNADHAFLGNYVAKHILKFEILKQDGYLLELAINQSFEDCIKDLRSKLGLAQVKSVKSSDFISTATLITGSGASYIHDITTDCLLTGDIKYHDAIAGQALKKSMFDIGHFESEHWFNDALELALEQIASLSSIKLVKLYSQNPFIIY